MTQVVPHKMALEILCKEKAEEDKSRTTDGKLRLGLKRQRLADKKEANEAHKPRVEQAVIDKAAQLHVSAPVARLMQHGLSSSPPAVEEVTKGARAMGGLRGCGGGEEGRPPSI